MENFLDIWHIPFKDLHVETSTLHVDEIQRANSFVKASDRDNYILSHTYLRKVLSSYYLHVEAKELLFEFNKYTKPRLNKKYKLHFNLSHSKTCAYIICSDEECGIDIEEKTDLELTDTLAKLVFCEEEFIEYKISENKEDYFYKIWTLKEAYLKALGIGIALKPMNELNIKEKRKTTLLKNKLLENDKYLAYCLLDSPLHVEPIYKSLKDIKY